MEIFTTSLSLSSQGNSSIYNITEEVQKIVNAEHFTEGQVTVFSVGSTTGISTVEYEPGLVNHDVNEMLNKLAPYGNPYEHNKTWGDDNGASHLRSTLIGASLNVPFVDGELVLGTWQQIIFLDFDTRPRNRRIIVQILGNK